MTMKFYKLLLVYRLQIGVALLALSGVLAYIKSWEWFWTAIILAVIAIVSHFIFGPLRLIQEAIQNNDMPLAQKYMKTVYFPQLLLKPIRQGFYMLKSNMAMSNQDFKSAEDYMRKSMKSKSKLVGEESEGASHLQMGMIALQNGKSSEARKNLKLALEKGLPDKDTKAAALIQLSTIEIQSRNINMARNYFKKAKQLNPQTPEIKAQIAQMDKYIHRAGTR